MARFPDDSILVPAVIVGAALTLGGCNSLPTYGTGTTVATQTVEDLTGILSLGSNNSKQQIDYEARPPIVEPPTKTLPPPGSEPSVEVANNWPVDPDEEKKRIDKLVEERNAAGDPVKFTVPVPERRNDTQTVSNSDREPYSVQVRKEWMERKSNPKEMKKLFADAKNARVGSFDENGNPVRQYLIEPPTTYREPDPDSPVDITEKPKKKKKFKLPNLWPF